LSGKAWGDSFIFHDLADTVTGEHQGTLPPDICPLCGSATFRFIASADDPRFESLALELVGVEFLQRNPDVRNIPHFDTKSVAIYEGDGTLSDFIIAANPGDPSTIGIQFFSDKEGMSLADVPVIAALLPTASRIVEDGSVQDAIHIHWDDGSNQTIQFQSDVPEPSSLFLLGTVALGLAGTLGRRRLARNGAL
jgi:hypothetical protein